MNQLYVQFGCGMSGPAGWRNFDASPTLRFERLPLIGSFYTRNERRFPESVEVGDVVRGLPIAPGSCRAVYCSHVLEHLSLEEFRSALRNTWAILQAGGVFRLVVPDLEYSVRQYMLDPSPGAAPDFMSETRLGHESRSRTFKGFLREWLSRGDHLWMWDYRSIRQELQNAGFVEIRRAAFGDAEDPKFAEVEEESRWTDCLGVQCKRPG
jgi:predicted SAM-dependent methyltransferase